jgi:hypothetical protein
VDFREQTFGCFQLAVDERGVEDQPRRIVGDLGLPPQFNLALQRLEVPLNPVHADRERVNQIEALGVLGQDRREHPRNNVSKLFECLTFNFRRLTSRTKMPCLAPFSVLSTYFGTGVGAQIL